MKYILYFLIYLYISTGIFIAIKTPFKRIIGKVLASIYFSLFWLPVLCAELIIKRTKE
ncbi:hypothetical protein [Clostridium botulinum]|uniref:hypothetical protein n=1 Tax=Clostridium botulinum TaxID=1491 RepID=UPI000A91CC5D|nr:hypothetical protein [Clostridium botulinum]